MDTQRGMRLLEERGAVRSLRLGRVPSKRVPPEALRVGRLETQVGSLRFVDRAKLACRAPWGTPYLPPCLSSPKLTPPRSERFRSGGRIIGRHRAAPPVSRYHRQREGAGMVGVSLAPFPPLRAVSRTRPATGQ